ncbi:MAG: hypothetical protein L0Y50_02445 [Beijerinckiaceae bacterium]|nr:hypothetical protein [Beijerinckiaceae bacterium]
MTIYSREQAADKCWLHLTRHEPQEIACHPICTRLRAARTLTRPRVVPSSDPAPDPSRGAAKPRPE